MSAKGVLDQVSVIATDVLITNTESRFSLWLNRILEQTVGLGSKVNNVKWSKLKVERGFNKA